MLPTDIANILLTLVFYFVVVIVAYLLSQVVSNKTPIKVTLIATIAAATAHLLVSAIYHYSLIPG